MLTELQGQIERITLSNEENGFKVNVPDRQDLACAVGNLMARYLAKSSIGKKIKILPRISIFTLELFFNEGEVNTAIKLKKETTMKRKPSRLFMAAVLLYAPLLTGAAR